MGEPTPLIPFVVDVVRASALLRHLQVRPEQPEAFLQRFAAELSGYFELSVPHTFDRLGLMTRGQGEAFSGLVQGWLDEVAGRAAAEGFAATAERFGHGHAYVKAVFRQGQPPQPTWYYRQRIPGPRAMQLLAAEGLPSASLELLRQAAGFLSKDALAFVGRRVVDGGAADRIKAYFTQYLPDGARAIGDRLHAVARLFGVRDDHLRCLRASVNALADTAGATMFCALAFGPGPVPEIKIYFEKVPAPPLLATLDAMKILVPGFSEPTPLPALLGTLNGLFGTDRVSYLGLRFGGEAPEATLYYFRSDTP